jgi:RNA 3'-phosphate cyclase
MIQLDGAEGEGGGQILRSSLALSILTRKPFKLINIRAGRPKPGLAPQHLASVKAAATICDATYKGASIGSSTLYFEPGEVKSGKYLFSINTAGATSLVLHTVYLPLALRGGGPSEVTITGGTHVSHSPCYHFLETTWAAHLRTLGLELDLDLVRPGFYPRGGGEIRATIQPCKQLKSLFEMGSPELSTAGGFSAVAGLDDGINKRQARRLSERLKRADLEPNIVQQNWEGGPGTVAGVQFRQLKVPASFYALGERGRPAEAVADDVAEQAIAFAAARCPIDPHSADQLVLPLAFSPDSSSFRVSEITRHLTTNIQVIQKFVERDINCEGVEGSAGTVHILAD